MCSFKILVFAVSFIVTLEAAQLNRLSAPVPGLKKYEIVQPVFQHARTKREIPSQGRDESGSYPRKDIIKINNYLVDIRMNLDLLPEYFVISYQKNGRTIHQKPKNEVKEFCYYGGTVRGKPNSWVAVSTCHGVEGAIYDGDSLKYIQPVQGSHTYQHLLYEHNDLSQPFECGTSSATNNTNHVPQKYQKIEFSKEQEEQTMEDHWYKKQAPDFMKMEDKKPHLENEPWRYIEQVLVADISIFEANNRDLHSVSHKMKSLINVVNGFYIPLNISIILVGVVVWNEKDKVTISSDAYATLDDFKEYRRTKLVKEIPNDNAFLITEKKFKQNAITGRTALGLASMGAMCSSYESCGLAINGTMTGPLAMIVAHEIGHNLGMEHDTKNITDPVCKCPDDTCIMYPSTLFAFRTVHWSLCSLNDLKWGFSQGLDYCLRNKPKRLIKFSVCGNGFVEAGEQCDCGTVTDPRAANLCHQCCDPKTCKLRTNATCGAGQCCDLQTCRPKSTGTMCRSAKSECDLPEYCTGESGNCPDDVHKMDTTSCGQGEQAAYCVRGECHSHTDQCRLIWGAESKICNAEVYDEINDKEPMLADCGLDITNHEFKRCRPQDTICGRLYCKCEGQCDLQLKNWLSYSYKNYNSSLARWFSNYTVIDMGLSVVDPGLVPDGAICGHNKMCLNQECVSVSELRARILNNKTLPCPSNCSGHGICNSGHCDCERGYIPPLCTPPEFIDTNDYESTTNYPTRSTNDPIRSTNDPIKSTKPGPTAGTERVPTTISTGSTKRVETTVTTSEPKDFGSTTEKSNNTSHDSDTGPLPLYMVIFYVCLVSTALGLVVGLIYYFRKSDQLRNLFEKLT